MSISVFKKLAHNFCELTGLDEPSRLVEGGAIELNDVSFSFVYNEKYSPNVLTIYCDFGPAPSHRKAEVYEALLEANMFVHVGHFPAFMIFQPTKHVVFATHRPLSITPGELADLLLDVAGQAKDWTEHYFQASASSFPHSRTAQ